MSKQFKESENYFIVTDTETGIEEIREPKTAISYKEINGVIHFYKRETREKISVYEYKMDNIVNGNELEALFEDLLSLKSYLDQHTGKYNGGSSSTTTEISEFAGIIDYADTSTTASPIDISTTDLNLDTWIDLPNNGLGDGSDNTVLGSPNIIDTLTGNFYFTELKQGAKIEIRIDLSVTTITPNTVVRVRLIQAVGDPLEKSIVFAHRFFKKARTLDSYIFTTVFDVTSDAYYLNPTKLQIMSDDTCAVINNGARFWITQ